MGPAAGEAPILLVDALPANLDALADILAPLGQPLVAARTGDEALWHLAGGAISVALCDAHVPGF